MDTSSVTAHWYLFFALSKFTELGDTVFLVLRKRPLTFLHCYHHCSVMVYTFNAGAEHLACGRWFMWMNLTVCSNNLKLILNFVPGAQLNVHLLRNYEHRRLQSSPSRGKMCNACSNNPNVPGNQRFGQRLFDQTHFVSFEC